MVAATSLRRLLAATVLAVLLTSAAAAQDRATLVADRLEIAGDSQLIAEGGVEVFFQGRRLTATRIVYDQTAGRLNIEGPIRLTDESGDTVILASQADLAADMTEGLMTSARVVLSRQLQMAATEVRRVGGRYLQLNNAVASSCRVCTGSDTPLWELRARRVTHDQTERQIYFDHAQLRFGGVPVFYIPRLRLPDPTLKRATGFLLPKFSSSTTLGTGVEMPYFITLGPSRDLRITPFVTTDNARSVALRYRQAFARGNITLSGALSRDAVTEGLRGYVIADGGFTLPNDYRLSFHGETASDPAYMADYDIAESDRLTSSVDVTRVRRNELVYSSFKSIKSLRSEETASRIPSIIGDAMWLHRFTGLGGQGNLRFASHGHIRASTFSLDADADGISDGRDVARALVGADWRRDWVLPGGVIGAVLGETRLDIYDVAQDPVLEGRSTRIWGAAGVELRWPLVRTGQSGATQVLEPVMQIITARSSDVALPNEDSLLVEFDEASLLSLNRFPGSDAVETGLRANLGLSWTRFDADGWNMGATFGRIIRADDDNGFSTASGLDGETSDWLAAFHMDTGAGLYAAARLIADDALNVARGEVQMQYSADRVTLGSGYVWSIADAAEFRSEDVSEMLVTAGYGLSQNWRANALGRYDFAAGSASRAGLGLRFKNECVLLDLSLSRRFTSSTRIQPDTRFGVTLELIGFGSSGSAGPARMCGR